MSDDRWVWHDASEGVVCDSAGLWECTGCGGWYTDQEDHPASAQQKMYDAILTHRAVVKAVPDACPDSDECPVCLLADEMLSVRDDE